MTRETELILQMIRSNFSITDAYNFDAVDWNVLIDNLKKQRIFLYAYQILTLYMPDQYHKEIEEYYSQQMEKLHNNLRQLEKFVEEAQKEKLRFILMKGFVLSKQLYGDLFRRQFTDIDILVEQDDLVRVNYLLIKMGYKQLYEYDYKTLYNKELKYPLKKVRQAHHLYPFYYSGTNPWQKFEVHETLHFVPMNHVKDFLWNVERINIGSVELNTFNLEYSLISLLLNTYEDSDTLFALQVDSNIRGYIDLFNFFNRYKRNINWSEVERLLEKYGYIAIANRLFDHISELYQDKEILTYKFKEKKEISFWDLQMNFVDQMFDVNNRKKKIQDMIRESIFEKERPTRLIRRTMCEETMWKYNSCYSLDISYQITYSDQSLQIFLLLDSRIVADIEKYLFQFVIYNSCRDNDTLCSLIEFSYDKRCVANIINSPVVEKSANLRNAYPMKKLHCYSELKGEKVLLSGEIRFQEMGIKNCNSNDKFAVAFNWFKHIHPSIYDTMEMEGETFEKAIVLVFADNEEQKGEFST